jgi:hypothetical protein
MNTINLVHFLLRPAIALLVMLSLAAPAAAQPANPPAHEPARVPLTLELHAVDSSAASGTATVDIQPDQIQAALLTVGLEGLAPGATYVAHLHAGTADAPSASFGLLGTLVSDAEGRASMQTSTLSMSAGGEVIDLSLDLLTDGDHLIDVHSIAGDVVMLGEIPHAEAAPYAVERAQAICGDRDFGG